MYQLIPEFNDIIITFTEQNGRPLEIEDNITKNTSKDMDFCHLREIYQTNMAKNYLLISQKQY